MGERTGDSPVWWASKREYIATHIDVPLATARAVLEAQGMEPEQITIATLLEVRARLRVMEADALLRAFADADTEKVDAEPDDYRYQCRPTGSSSERYGPCEVCGEHVAEVYHQVTHKRKPNGDGWIYQQGLYGHESCLIAQRKNQQEIPE